MTRRELAAILALLAIVLILAALWPPSTRSDQPVAATAVPASAFLPLDGIGRPTASVIAASEAPVALPGGALRPASPTSRAGVTEPSAGITGTASWFASPIGVSAAGPALRTALGPGWRGTRVTVCGPAGCAVTVLGDWMRADRLIDLDAPVFAALAPLSQGLMEVSIEW